ncbi:MAG: hypothetical protein JWM04_473, partial [Verrucomicrobiales bacterium]|nr:hypothetical protein [Verrucomicrobiales bacterium]
MIDFNLNQSAGRQKSSPRRWMELHVRMQGARPPISRVILVPADATFGW